jgi:hypothetical protein
MAITDQPRVDNPEVLTPQFPDTVAPFVVPREAYIVDEELLDSLEASLVDELRENIDPEGPTIVTVIVPWDHPAANFGRMTETKAYTGYDNHAAMAQYEERSIWLYTVDTNPLGASGIDHVKRLVPAMTEEERAETGLTGIEVIDDRLTATDPNEVLDLSSLQEFHGIEDIGKVWNVTSNHVTGRVNEEGDMFSQLNTLISYKATYMLGKEAGVTDLFAYLNQGAIRSLGRTGVSHELLLGREFHLPEPGKPGHYDLDYVAVDIPYSPENEACFTDVYVHVPTSDRQLDKRGATRETISQIISGQEVPVYQLGPSTRDDTPVVTRRM